MQKTGDLKLIQELNRSIILKDVRDYGPISRSEIAKKNKISPTTVTAAIKELLKQELVCEEGEGESSGGRKPVLLKFSADSRFIIAVSITNTHMIIAETNLEAIIRKQKVFQLNDLEGKKFIDFLLKSIKNFIKKYSDLKRCIGISITLPGIIGPKKSVVYESIKLKLRNVPLKELLKKEFKLNIWLENDSNAVVLAEKRLGKYRKYKNLIYVSVGDGVGSGIVLNENLFRGSHGVSGEFGHTSIDINGIPCDCGNKGCLENYINWAAFLSKITFFISKGRNTIMLELAEGDIKKITPMIYKQALKKGDKLAKEITLEVARCLSVGIINLANMLDPDVIILGGEIFFDNDLLISSVEKSVLREVLSISSNKLKINQISLGKDFGVIAAAAIALQDTFHFSIGS